MNELIALLLSKKAHRFLKELPDAPPRNISMIHSEYHLSYCTVYKYLSILTKYGIVKIYKVGTSRVILPTEKAVYLKQFFNCIEQVLKHLNIRSEDH